MSLVREIKLPGVGVRHEFTTVDGSDVGVIVHHDGRREILSYDTDDPDACTTVLSLSEHDTQTLGEILGVSHVVETVASIRQEVDGLAIDWIDIDAGSKVAGSTIGDSELRKKTGASIVAVIRDSVPTPAPGADFQFLPGDVAVAVGTHEGLAALHSLLSH